MRILMHKLRIIGSSIIVLQLQAFSAALAQPTLPPEWSAGSWKPGQEIYDVGIEFDIPVRMSDGVTINAAIVVPIDPSTGQRAKGDFPVLLEQSPYTAVPSQQGWAETGLRMVAQYFVKRGYIYVLAEVRGTHHSGGEFKLMSTREKEDGVELVDWAAHRLDGSNGTIGLTGCSYTGLNQYFTAALVGKNSPVKAMAPASVGPDWYREPALIGGVPTTSMQKAFIDAWSTAGTKSAARFSLRAIGEIKSGGESAYDRKFWKARSAADLIPRIVENEIPALIIADWNDYPTSPSEAYTMFQNSYSGRDPWLPMKADQASSSRYQIIVGNEQHCAGRAGGRMDEALLKWFDTWLKNADTGVRDATKTMHLWELNSRRWVSSSVYPKVDKYQTFYLHSNGLLAPAKPAEDVANDQVAYVLPNQPSGSVIYTTAPFAEGATLAGPVSATFYAESTKTNIILIADLFDVSPDGETTQLSMGAQIGSMQTLDESKTWHDSDKRLIRPYHFFDKDNPVEPGITYRMDMQLQPRQAAIKPGHSIRLVLKTQSDPTPCGALFPGGTSFWCLDPTVSQRKALEGAVFDVHRNNTWPSQINLPLAPYFDSK